MKAYPSIFRHSLRQPSSEDSNPHRVYGCLGRWDGGGGESHLPFALKDPEHQELNAEEHRPPEEFSC